LDDWIASYLGEWRTSLLIVDLTLSLGITTVLFAFVYKYIPQAKMEWGDVWVGALVAAALFNVGKLAIGYYLGRSAFAANYGAAGSFLVLLLWAYYSAQIFLFGAEFTKSFSYISGTRRGLKI
jgi:membrane protein